jgi:phospholipid/cholesterol/gamma-HCH transport system substrate-binding protein
VVRKELPLGRLMVAILFALSCFGILLFLWVTFGGPALLAAESYRLTVDLPHAGSLVKQSDVRIGGVTVGKVETIGLDPSNTQARVELEIDAQYAPLPGDSRAIVRQKTLLGETYLELTGGTDAAEPVPDGGQLADGQVARQTQIDEIYNALDPPTRQAVRVWMRNAAVAVEGRGLDLNDALGNLSPFLVKAEEVLAALDRQRRPLGRGIRDAGEFFQALTSRDAQLAGAITGSNAVFGALASRDAALAETIRILPTFEREARFTLSRLEQFAADATPLVRTLHPVARDLGPTLRSVRRLSPDLRALLTDLDPLISSAREGFPALAETLEEVRPLVSALDPFLANLAPILRYVDFYRFGVGDFLAAPGVGFAGELERRPGATGPEHVLRVEAYSNSESFAVHPTRLPTNRGNSYLPPLTIRAAEQISRGAWIPSFDCKPSGGEVGAKPGQYVGPGFPSGAQAPCVVGKGYPSAFGGGQAPNVYADP